MKVYIDAVPQCEFGHAMIRKDPPWGTHSAGVWTCSNPECTRYGFLLVVPMVAVEALQIGMSDAPGEMHSLTDYRPPQ